MRNRATSTRSRLLRSTVHLAVAVVLLSGAVAAEKIEEAFGLKLGQVFDPTAPEVGETGKGQSEYAFTPNPPNPMFSTYVVCVSPVSHVVYRIAAKGEAPDVPSYEKMYDRVAAVLNNKYGSAPYGAASVLQSPRLISLESTTKPDKKIAYTLSYSDAGLEQQARDEQKTLDQAALEQKQKQLLKETDASGL